MNKSLMTLVCCVSFSSCIAQAASSACLPQNFGGKADGKTLNTHAIQQAIQQCSQRGGGTVQLSPGLWLSGPLQLQSNIRLQIEKGATLKASNQEGKFISAFIGHPAKVNEAFIFASNVNNVAITGEAHWMAMERKAGGLKH
ncbi:hypothetical protein [Erwinia sp. E_sp_W01_6]|uniref:hypothetical protein n=1 Tax=Erwinia sp. E_sp_W01_6 TaxID=3039408 RepID=UPI0030CF2640